MQRTIIQIDEAKCNGCGLCADACHEGAIGMVEGKAKLLRDDFCDGLGDCLPACPTGAITFVEREALPYNEAAVLAAQQGAGTATGGGCPGAQARTLVPSAPENAPAGSCLAQWPAQIKLMPLNAPYYQGCDLLVAADCTAFAYAAFHQHYMDGKVTVIGCPKLDAIDYTEKLTAIIATNDVKSVTVARMEVPCCGGLERAALEAVAGSGKQIPTEVVTFTVDGNVK